MTCDAFSRVRAGDFCRKGEPFACFPCYLSVKESQHKPTRTRRPQPAWRNADRRSAPPAQILRNSLLFFPVRREIRIPEFLAARICSAFEQPLLLAARSGGPLHRGFGVIGPTGCAL